MSDEKLKHDLENLRRWREDGTSAWLDRARATKQRVWIKRTSGEMVKGIIAGWGYAGLTQVVAWVADADLSEPAQRVLLAMVTWDVGADRVYFPAGVVGKRVSTEDLLRWNPEI